jgi:hypothetical protein
MLRRNAKGELVVGDAGVKTTQNQGLPVEYWAGRCVDRIIKVSEDSDSILRDQAIVFRENIRQEIQTHMEQAIRSYRTTLYNLFVKQGHKDMAEILRRL